MKHGSKVELSNKLLTARHDSYTGNVDIGFDRLISKVPLLADVCYRIIIATFYNKVVVL